MMPFMWRHALDIQDSVELLYVLENYSKEFLSKSKINKFLLHVCKHTKKDNILRLQIEFLLRLGVDVNTIDETTGLNALQLLARSTHQKNEYVKDSVLIWFIKQGATSPTNLLFDVYYNFTSYDNYDYYIQHSENHSDRLYDILLSNQYDVHEIHKKCGMTLLYMAVRDGKMENIEYLLLHGAITDLYVQCFDNDVKHGSAYDYAFKNYYNKDEHAIFSMLIRYKDEHNAYYTKLFQEIEFTSLYPIKHVLLSMFLI